MGGGALGEGEANSQLSKEPNAGLDPRILGPRPEPPRCPVCAYFFFIFLD